MKKQTLLSEMTTREINRRHSRLSELRSKAKRLNLHSVLTILHYPTGHALTIT